ncbi:MAG: tyrosine-type recombinase/integrase [Bacteroidota bacterium]
MIERYMAAYAGHDRTRVTTLARWAGALGDRPLASITDDDVFRILEEIRSEPARVYAGRDADGRPIQRAKGLRATSTCNRYLAAIQALFTWAIKRRLAPRGWDNPARRVERAPERNAVVRFLAQDELERLLKACRSSSWTRLYLLVLMALTTGARRSELLSLTWGDVDLERAVAHLRDTKNGHPRTLPLVLAVLEELRRFREERAEVRLFPARASKLNARVFDPSWQTALRTAGIKSFRFHDLRHTCASYLAQNGASLLEIADVMGHRQLAMVKRYAHLTTDSKAKLVNRILGGIQ